VKLVDGRWVRDTTGFAIGGVSPIGHANGLCAFIDADLLALDLMWVAAGSPAHVYRTSAAKLVRMTGGETADVKEDA